MWQHLNGTTWVASNAALSIYVVLFPAYTHCDGVARAVAKEKCTSVEACSHGLGHHDHCTSVEANSLSTFSVQGRMYHIHSKKSQTLHFQPFSSLSNSSPAYIKHWHKYSICTPTPAKKTVHTMVAEEGRVSGSHSSRSKQSNILSSSHGHTAQITFNKMT